MQTRLNLMQALSAILLAASWLVSNHYPPWTAFYNDFTAVLALLVMSFAVVGTGSFRQRLDFPAPAIAVGVLASVPFLQYGSGLIDFLGDAVISSGYLGLLALSMVVGANLRRQWGSDFATVLAWSCLVGSVLSVMLALHQWLGLGELGIWLMGVPPNGRPYANLGQPNNLATLLCLGLAAALYLRERGQFGRVVLALLAVLLFAGMTITRSRTAILAVAVMALWIFWGRRRLGLRCSVPETLAGVTVFALLWAGWPTLSSWVHLGAESTLARLGSPYSGEVRLVLWQQLLDAVWRQPVFGYGWNQVAVAQMAVVAEYPNIPTADHAHNLVIDLLVWNGALLGGLLVLALAAWLYLQIRRLDSTESWFALLFVLLVLVHAMLELPHAYAYFLIPIGLCVGILSAGQRFSFTLSRRVYAVFVATGVLVAGWIFVEYQTIESDHRLMRFESVGIEQRPADAVAPKVVLLTQLQEFIRFARTEAREGMTDEEIHRMGQVAHRYPFPPALMRYAIALGLNHHPEAATLELRRLMKIQGPDQFEEVRVAWPLLAERYPQLGRVALPPHEVR